MYMPYRLLPALCILMLGLDASIIAYGLKNKKYFIVGLNIGFAIYWAAVLIRFVFNR